MEKILNWKLITHILEKIDEDLLIGICRTRENDGMFKELKLFLSDDSGKKKFFHVYCIHIYIFKQNIYDSFNFCNNSHL